jgi:hypothetical protein
MANRGDDPRPPRSGSKLFPAHLVLAALGDIRACHREFGIPDEISWATLSHLGRAIRNYRAVHGETGVAVSDWDWMRYFGRLYEVGRLQVTPYLLRTHPKEAGPLFWYEDAEAERLGAGWRRGDPALGLHVPATGALTPAECDDALSRLRPAFAERYPGMPLRIATATSWLLDEQLAEYLPADSNIVRFQRRFRLVPGVQQYDDAVARMVAGAGTALDRAVQRHFQQGHHWHLRTGWIEL